MAASISPGSTDLNADSITLATKGIADIVNGTIAAVDPKEVPTIALVTGITKINKIMNGNDLKVLTIKSNI